LYWSRVLWWLFWVIQQRSIIVEKIFSNKCKSFFILFSNIKESKKVIFDRINAIVSS
jgi:hypothetical protein